LDYTKINAQSWDKKVEENHIYTSAVSSEEVQRARDGNIQIYLTPSKPIPRDWYPEILEGKDVLCLASGGGQQGPLIAACGCNVTVFDISEKQLQQDNMVAKRDNLNIKTLQGDMRDLSAFDDDSFDMIIHPWSNSYVDSVLPVWLESYRVLRKGGVLLSGFANPIESIFDLEDMREGKLTIRHSIPYSDLTSLSEQELKRVILDKGESIAFGHTLHDQIQGQIDAGFLIGGFYEDISYTPLDEYINASICTKAIKL